MRRPVPGRGSAGGVQLAAVLFDFDGLILDTETSEFLTVADAFADHGLELSRDEWVAIIGTADHPHWTDMLETALGRPLDDREGVLETRRARHHARISQERLRPGVVDLVTELTRAEIPKAVASSSPLAWVRGHLDDHGIAAHFATFATRDDVGAARTKPHPDLYLLAAERLGVDPTRCVVLEDSAPGVHAGNAAGCTTVAVPAGMTADVDFSHADLVVDSLAALDVARLEAAVAANAPR